MTIESRRVMIDTMIHDKLVADPAALSRLETLVAKGAIELLTTHIQQDQLAAIDDPDRRLEMGKIAAQKVPTSALVFDLSRWDEAEWGTTETNASVEALARDNPRHLPDALIGTTAVAKADLLVTDDVTLMKRLHAIAPDFAVLTFERFVALLDVLAREHLN